MAREDLLACYDAVVYATGAPGDRPLGVPGEDLAGSWAATDFVGWYNAHPDHGGLEFDLSCERAVVVGNGNVALDVARMLTLAHEDLAVTDTADHALEALKGSRVSEVVVVGRRGPAQAAFTNPELLELAEMDGVDVVVDGEELERALALDDPNMDPTSQRNVKALREYAARAPSGAPRRIVLRFLLSPVRIGGEDGRVSEVQFAVNELFADQSGALRARDTGQRESLKAGLVLRAIGYRGRPLPGVPFDQQTATIRNKQGRVVDADGSFCVGEYVVGWIKRGPSGVIGTNKKDAQQTVDAILQDIHAGNLNTPASPGPDSIKELLQQRQPNLVTYSGWSQIDKHERSLGEPSGRPRIKLTNIEKMLQIAASETPTDEPLDTLGLR